MKTWKRGMSQNLTSDGKCPGCGNQIVQVDRANARRMFYAVKAMIIDQDNGAVVSRCSQCKVELTMPAVKMPRRIRTQPDAN